MPATVPKTDLSGIRSSAGELIDAAFKRGVKYGRYLEQQERPKITRCKDCALLNDSIGASGRSWCEAFGTLVPLYGFCHCAEQKE